MEFLKSALELIPQYLNGEVWLANEWLLCLSVLAIVATTDGHAHKYDHDILAIVIQLVYDQPTGNWLLCVAYQGWQVDDKDWT